VRRLHDLRKGLGEGGVLVRSWGRGAPFRGLQLLLLLFRRGGRGRVGGDGPELLSALGASVFVVFVVASRSTVLLQFILLLAATLVAKLVVGTCFLRDRCFFRFFFVRGCLEASRILAADDIASPLSLFSASHLFLFSSDSGLRQQI